MSTCHCSRRDHHDPDRGLRQFADRFFSVTPFSFSSVACQQEHRLTPRRSFLAWSQSHSRSRPLPNRRPRRAISSTPSCSQSAINADPCRYSHPPRPSPSSRQSALPCSLALTGLFASVNTANPGSCIPFWSAYPCAGSLLQRRFFLPVFFKLLAAHIH
jgi:hypothetical protein